MKKYTNKDFDKIPLRIDRIIHTSAAAVDGSVTNSFYELFTDNTDSELIDIFGKLPLFMELLNEECVEYDIDFDEIPKFEVVEHIIEWVNNEGDGFLIECHTPYLEKSPAGFLKRSWGLYKVKWVFAKTYDECVEKGFKWAEDYIKKVS